MKPAETKRIYESACRSKRIVPNQDEFDRWHKVLRGYEARDVEAALDGWWSDATLTSNGRPRGAFLPEPAELKPLIEIAHIRREAAAREPQDMILWECAGVGRHRSSLFLPRSQPSPNGRQCQCGAELLVFARESL